MNHTPVLLIFIPIIFSIIIYLFNNKYVNYLAFLCQFFLIITAVLYHRSISNLEVHHVVVGGWDKTAGIALRNDWLSISTILLTIFLMLSILIYCWDKKEKDSNFLFLLLFVEGTFLGVLQTSDFFNLFVFIEITTVISSILILYKKDGNSLKTSLYYLLFNSVGMMFFLLGLVLLYAITGTLNMELATERIAVLGSTTSIRASYIFIMAAVGVKSAFFPVYNWLPKAHGAAPTAISALLSGLLVKSGLYSFIRINAVFGGVMFQQMFFLLGFTTALCGVIFALSQKDIKQILAFSTISQIGIMLIGISHTEGSIFYGGVLHLFNHAVFKTLLFLGAGVIIDQYGTNDVSEIRGAFKTLPFISIFMLVGMFSITGAPFFNGFISKSIINHSLSSAEQVMLGLINLGTVIYFVKFSQIFAGNRCARRTKHLHNNISMFLLAAMCILLGNFFIPITQALWNTQLLEIKTVSFAGLVKYLTTLALGVFIYLKIIKEEHYLIQKIRNTNISFETTNLMLLMFIVMMMASVYIF
jgi:multicomponent Na+:H+ antiporter subunit D